MSQSGSCKARALIWSCLLFKNKRDKKPLLKGLDLVWQYLLAAREGAEVEINGGNSSTKYGSTHEMSNFMKPIFPLGLSTYKSQQPLEDLCSKEYDFKIIYNSLFFSIRRKRRLSIKDHCNIRERTRSLTLIAGDKLQRQQLLSMEKNADYHILWL